MDYKWMYEDSGTGEPVPLFAGRTVILDVAVDLPRDRRGTRGRIRAGTPFRVLDATDERKLVVNTQYHPMPLRLDGPTVRKHGQVVTI